MRNFFKDYSLTGVVLIFCTFLLGVVLRFYNLSEQDPWTDELASFYYLRNLSQVFYHESHSPLYYAVLRLFLGEHASLASIRYFSATLSLLHLILAFILGKKVFPRNQFLLFWVLVCLNPLDIIYARMARHYSWLLESVLIFALWLRVSAPTWRVSLWAALLGFVHVFALIPVFMLSFFDYLEKKNLKRFLVMSASAFLVVIYYLIRIAVLGPAQVGRNVSWNTDSFSAFIKGLMLQFMGDSYPRHLFFPIPLSLALGFILLVLGFFIWKRSRAGLKWFTIALVSVAFIELVSSFWINLRINRYLIYLSPLLFLAIAETWNKIKDWQLLAVLGIMLAFVVYVNPIALYPWDDEAVKLWKAETKEGNHQTFICANPYQALYYGLKTRHPCSSALKELDFKRPVQLLDLNSNDKLLILYLMENMQLVSYKKVNNSLIIFFDPK